MNLSRTGLAALFILVTVFFFATPSLAAELKGRSIMESKGCMECHQIEGPATEKTIADVLAKKGPELWYAGSKFRDGFLAGWLSDPRPIRPLAYNSLTEENPGDHPALDLAEAALVAAYLMTLESQAVSPGVVVARNNIRGKKAFGKHYSCYGCHSFSRKGKVVGGLTGPTFAGAGKRLNPDWIYAYLKTPAIFKRVKSMPVFAGIMSEREMREISEYIASME